MHMTTKCGLAELGLDGSWKSSHHYHVTIKWLTADLKTRSCVYPYCIIRGLKRIWGNSGNPKKKIVLALHKVLQKIGKLC